MKKRVNVITLGCSKNTVDSEVLLRQLQAAGYEISHNAGAEAADTVIINTCGFINDAREESIDMILRFAGAKKRGLVNHLCIMGCLPQIYKEALRKEIPEVDTWFGTGSIKEILRRVTGRRHQNNLLPGRVITGPGHYAYVKVSEGCDRSCAFCSIPLIRGGHISKSIEDIHNEIITLENNGVRELILVAQDLNYYGVDLYGRRMLSNLIGRIASSTSAEWIRLQYLYPSGLSDTLLKTIKETPNVCRYIDMPIQHISDRVLRKMKRGYSGSSARKLLEMIKKHLPDAAIRTTLITGHPGETERDHKEMVEFIRSYRFDRLGVFRYSHEEKAYAGINYEDDVPEAVKESRAAEIMEVQQQISAQENRKKTGRVFKVLIDRMEGEYYAGRTEADSPEVDQEVLISSVHNLAAGNFYNIKITDSNEFDLFGIPA